MLLVAIHKTCRNLSPANFFIPHSTEVHLLLGVEAANPNVMESPKNQTVGCRVVSGMVEEFPEVPPAYFALTL
jgi:hypothetical protein